VLARGKRLLGLPKERARHLTAPQRVEVAAFGSVDQNGIDPAVRRFFCRLHLRLHAAGGHLAVGGPDHVVDLVGDGVHRRQALRVRGVVRIGGVEAVYVRADHEQIRLGQHRHVGGEVVVVAHPQLLGGDGVVFIHDRQRVPVEQLGDRVLRVHEAGAALQVVVGEQDLRTGHVEEAAPMGHQQRLAERGEGLPLRDGEARARPAPALLGEPGGHGAGGDQNHLLALPTALNYKARNGQQVRRAAAPIVGRNERAAHLHDGTGPVRERNGGHTRQADQSTEARCWLF
jgi:hypothetical protein